MAEHKLAILVSAVGAAKAAKELKGVDAAISRIGARAGKGLRTAGSNLLKLGAAGAAVGAGLAAVNIKAGVESLATLESAVTKVDGAISAMNLTGKVTGAQIAGWANEIEASVQAAFDDKDITAGAGALIRYGKVVPANLKTAMTVMTDLAAKTGSVESASTLLGKALADPANAAGKLARAGVILTDAQKKELASFGTLTKKQREHYIELRKSNKAEAEAYKRRVLAKRAIEGQAEVLRLIGQTTQGAASAMNGPWQDAMNTMGDTIEDAQRALAVGFMPVIKRASEMVTKFLGDKGTQKAIEDFGRSLAGAFDEAITFAQGIPWDKVGSGLKTAADWAGKLFQAFTSLPPEVQGTIVALAGLEKLSGGAVSGIVGELGKGLIKGVLSMNAGVVNINAGVVNGGGGGVPGVPGGGGTGVGGKIGGALKSLPIIGLGVAAVGAIYEQGKADQEAGRKSMQYYQTPSGQLAYGYPPEAKAADKAQTAATQKLATANDSKAHAQQIARAVDVSRADTRSELTANRRETAGVSIATRVGAASNVIAQAAAASRIVGAVQSAGRPTVNVYVNVPGANVRYGSSNGSSGTSGGGNRTNKPS